MRYLYVKNGNAVEQVQRIASQQFAVSPHGPDAFLSSFLENTIDSEVFLISRGPKNDSCRVRNVHAETRFGGANRLQRLWYKSAFAALLIARILSLRPDRIVCGSTGSQLVICRLGSWVFRCPMVHSRHNSVPDSPVTLIQRLRRASDIFVLRRLSAIAVHGPYLRDQLVACGVRADRIFEFEVHFPPCEFRNYATDRRLLLFIGRIEIGKGILDLLRAAEPLLQRYDDVELRFVGGGSALRTLAAAAEGNEKSRRIAVTGPVPHDQVLTLVQEALVVVTPTRTEFPEGRCMVALESIAMGTPVVAPNHGPFPYIVAHEKNGLLFESDSVQSLRDNLDRILCDPALLAQLRQGALDAAAKMQAANSDFGTAIGQAFASIS